MCTIVDLLIWQSVVAFSLLSLLSFGESFVPVNKQVYVCSSALKDHKNPLKHIMGTMGEWLNNSDKDRPQTGDIESLIKAVPSWDEIRSNLEKVQTEEERAFRRNVARGFGRASPLNLIRLFDEGNKEEDIRVTFFRDHASWCPYCQKVWMTLEEKCIPYRVEKINMRCYGEKPGSFLRLQPSGNIPVAIIDGKVFNQSNDIMFALESLFPNHKSLLRNESDFQRARTQRLLKLERTLFSVWMYWLTGSDAKGGKEDFVDVLNEVESELISVRDGDFFMGDNVSVVDFMFAPFLERMCASLLYYKGFQIRVASGESSAFPAINKWFDAMETLESYRVTKSDYYTHNWDLPPQLGGCTSENSGRPFALAINGDKLTREDRGSWNYPLVEHNGGVEPDWGWCGDDSAAAREAVERLSFNHENIAHFAARGAGQTGFPTFSAPLSDPKAKAKESIIPVVDGILRLVSLALLDGVDRWRPQIDDLSLTAKKNNLSDDIVLSLEYLRDRVGVPRDMRLPAARRLRATLNWSIEIISN